MRALATLVSIRNLNDLASMEMTPSLKAMMRTGVSRKLQNPVGPLSCYYFRGLAFVVILFLKWLLPIFDVLSFLYETPRLGSNEDPLLIRLPSNRTVSQESGVI
jgi:hypothetical protein